MSSRACQGSPSEISEGSSSAEANLRIRQALEALRHHTWAMAARYLHVQDCSVCNYSVGVHFGIGSRKTHRRCLCLPQ